ncbi:2-hydroxyacid dehydrogenase [Paenibacillus tarimensis]
MGCSMLNGKPLCAVDAAIDLTEEEIMRLRNSFELTTIDFLKPAAMSMLDFDLLLAHSKLPDDLVKNFRKCRYIGFRAHNTDYINPNIAKELGITVKGIPQIGANAVAEHTFALIFAVTKRIVASNENVVNGKWREQSKPNYELCGKTLGIIGYGKIGKLVAGFGRLFGMDVLVASTPGEKEIGRAPLEEVLEQSDILTLHASTKAGNDNLLNRERMFMMKDNAIIINTARGKLMDYNALEEALKSGKLFGVGLDVFPEEPVQSLELCQLPNVVSTPHHAFYTDRTIALMNRHLIDNAVTYFTPKESLQ